MILAGLKRKAILSVTQAINLISVFGIIEDNGQLCIVVDRKRSNLSRKILFTHIVDTVKKISMG